MVRGAEMLWSLSWLAAPPTTEAQALPRAVEPIAWVTPSVRAPGVRQCTFESAAAGATVSFFVYTPEAYDREPQRRFPVVYWLHGTGGGLAGVPQVARRFGRAIREGRCPPLIIVFPNGLRSSMWCDSHDGRVPMETVVVRGLVPHVDATLRTLPERNGRVIEGFSMGGYGAARLGFRHTGVFGGVSTLGAGPLDLDLMGPRATGNRTQRESLLRDVYGGSMEHFRAQARGRWRRCTPRR